MGQGIARATHAHSMAHPESRHSQDPLPLAQGSLRWPGLTAGRWQVPGGRRAGPVPQTRQRGAVAFPGAAQCSTSLSLLSFSGPGTAAPRKYSSQEHFWQAPGSQTHRLGRDLQGHPVQPLPVARNPPRAAQVLPMQMCTGSEPNPDRCLALMSGEQARAEKGARRGWAAGGSGRTAENLPSKRAP